MTKIILTILDVTGVQNYIFGSNKLKHIIGASGLVHNVTNDWLFSSLLKIGKTNVNDKGEYDKSVQITQLDCDSELIYAGGGNAAILFKPGREIEFARILSTKLINEAPGLDCIISHDCVEWDSTEEKNYLRNKFQDLMWTVSYKKQARERSVPINSIGVTVTCPYSGKPAVGRDEDGNRVSAEILAKASAFFDADKRLKKSFGNHDYLYDLEKIEGDEKGSYIAVVHSDGTDMGKRIKKISENPENNDNRKFIENMREFSLSIKSASNAAMNATIEKLASIDKELVPQPDGELQFRPIIFGGDDITFLCYGMIGLELATYHLKQVSADTNKLSDDKPIFARSGVAIVKSHFPISLAYQIAETLNRHARNFAKNIDENIPPATLDWYFSSSGPVLDIDRIRAKKYILDDMNLRMRPIVVCGKGAKNWRSWDCFIDIVKEFKSDGYSNSFCNELFSVLPQGHSSVIKLLDTKNLPLPKIPKHPTAERWGWIGYRCVYHDPLEAMDFVSGI